MIACLTVPYFPTAVEHRENDALTERNRQESGLILGGQPWEPQPVYAFSREAAVRGVRPGMSLRLAHVLSPEAHFMRASPPRYLNASGEITDILTDFTDLIEPEALWLPALGEKPKGPIQGPYSARLMPARFNLDLESLPQKEAEGLAREIGKKVRGHTKLIPTIGLASSKFVAQIAASLTRPNHTRSIGVGDENKFLSSRSIHFLPLENETARRLSVLGIRTLGQLTAIPLSSLYAQISVSNRPGHSLGRDFSALYHLAKGEIQQSAALTANGHNQLLKIQQLKTDKKERIVQSFESPVRDLTIIESVLNRTATEIAGRLQAQNLECQFIQLAVETDLSLGEESQHLFETTRRTPTSDPTLLASTMRNLLSRFQVEFDPGGNSSSSSQGIISIAISVGEISRSSTFQMSLFQPPQAANKVEQVLENIVMKHGSQWYFKPILSTIDHSLPERRFLIQELNST